MSSIMVSRIKFDRSGDADGARPDSDSGEFICSYYLLRNEIHGSREWGGQGRPPLQGFSLTRANPRLLNRFLCQDCARGGDVICVRYHFEASQSDFAKWPNANYISIPWNVARMGSRRKRTQLAWAADYDLARSCPLNDIALANSGHQFRKQVGRTGKDRHIQSRKLRRNRLAETGSAVVVQVKKRNHLDPGSDQARGPLDHLGMWAAFVQ